MEAGRISLSDGILLALYREWSEEFYAAGFMSPSEHTVSEFIRWLRDAQSAEAEADYEREFLEEFHRQWSGE